MVKHFFLIGCFTCIITEKYTNVPKVNCKVNNYHYIEPNITVNQWDSLEVGDTLKINKKTLKL